jgi:hypothetical protein
MISSGGSDLFALWASGVHCADRWLAGLQVVPNPPTRCKPRANAAHTLEDYPLAVGSANPLLWRAACLVLSGMAH